MLRRGSALAALVLGMAVIFPPGGSIGTGLAAVAAPLEDETWTTTTSEAPRGGYKAWKAKPAAAAPYGNYWRRGQARQSYSVRSGVPAPVVAAKRRKPLKLPPQEEDVSTASIPQPTEERGVERLRGPLEALARAMSGSAGGGPPPAQAPTPPDRLAFALPLPDQAGAAALPAPRSITFDLETGVKTVVFRDGVAASVPVDPAELRRVTQLRGSR